LTLPVHVIYGPNGKAFERLPKLAADHTNWHLSRISPARELPHFERPDETLSALDTFWSSLG